MKAAKKLTASAETNESQAVTPSMDVKVIELKRYELRKVNKLHKHEIQHCCPASRFS